MRELKFRACDLNRLKEFGQPCMSNPFTFKDIKIDDNGRQFLFCTIGFGEFIFYLDECEIMQYTGLKDKNWKEIYEGDIILDEENNTLAIEYYRDGFHVMYKKRDKTVPYDHIAYDNNEIVDIIIIGNIYEHGDILEEQNVR